MSPGDSLEMARNKIYGQHIFDEVSAHFTRNQSLIPPDDYIIGPGDQLIVSIWGPSELQEILTVERDGSIFRQNLGKIVLAGYTYGDVKRMLERRYRRITNPGSNIQIVMGQNRRTVSVNIVGEVNEPGTYEIFANNTAYNALFYANGIAPNGSVRNIRVRRNGRIVKVFDMYKFWLEGEDDPLFLDNNDYVFVPVHGKVVKISGSVKRPMRYELKEEENLAALLKFAGGFTTHARTSNVQIRRIKNGKEIYDDVSLDSLIGNGQDYLLMDGDEVVVQEQKRQQYNVVQVEGGVMYPDMYELVPGQRVMDIIRKAGGLDTSAYLKRAYITRLVRPGEIEYIDIDLEKAIQGDPAHNIRMQFFDQLLVFLETDFQEEKYIHVTGEVRQPDSFLVSPNMSLKDVLLLARGLNEDADLNNIELSTFTRKLELTIDSLAVEEELSEEEEPRLELPESDLIIRRVAIPRNWEDDPGLDTIMVSAYNQVRVYSKYDFTH
ncbi:MAG: hypothetical protein D6730_06440, partial [Bacteroidetes bacterium]